MQEKEFSVPKYIVYFILSIYFFRMEECPPGGISTWRRVRLEACPPGGAELESCPPGGLQLEGCPTGGTCEIYQLEECPPGEVSALEACPPGGVSSWRLVRWRDDCQPTASKAF